MAHERPQGPDPRRARAGQQEGGAAQHSNSQAVARGGGRGGERGLPLPVQREGRGGQPGGVLGEGQEVEEEAGGDEGLREEGVRVRALPVRHQERHGRRTGGFGALVLVVLSGGQRRVQPGGDGRERRGLGRRAGVVGLGRGLTCQEGT